MNKTLLLAVLAVARGLKLFAGIQKQLLINKFQGLVQQLTEVENPKVVKVVLA
jgi:hypothetical protein